MRNCFLWLCIFMLNCTLHAQNKLFQQAYNELDGFGLTEFELQEHQNEGELVVFNEAKHRTKLAKKLLDKGKKHKEKTQTGVKTYEVIAERDVMHYRINYIFLDGNRTDVETAKKIREKINGMLNEGIQFKSLARQYSMDRNSYSGGDSGWFKEERTVPDFFQQINNPKLLANQVYEVDLEEAKWYYLVQKTYTPTNLREILVKISE